MEITKINILPLQPKFANKDQTMEYFGFAKKVPLLSKGTYRNLNSTKILVLDILIQPVATC